MTEPSRPPARSATWFCSARGAHGRRGARVRRSRVRAEGWTRRAAHLEHKVARLHVEERAPEILEVLHSQSLNSSRRTLDF